MSTRDPHHGMIATLTPVPVVACWLRLVGSGVGRTGLLVEETTGELWMPGADRVGGPGG